jgi:hypothetical protein
VASNLENLQARYIAAAGELTNLLARDKCLVAIDDWFTARTAASAVGGNEISGYSINGRSVTRRAVKEIQDRVAVLEGQIEGMLYGLGVQLVDNRDYYGLDGGLRV